MEKDKLKALILQAIQQQGVKKEIKSLCLFGSHLTGKAKADSDVDLLVEFMPQARIGYFRLVDIQNMIARSVGKKIDLLTPEALSKHFRQDVIVAAEKIYEQ